MPGPWEQYQAPQAKPAAGPWESYAKPETPKVPAAKAKPEPSFLSSAANAIGDAIPMVGIGEAGLNMGSGMIAKPLSDIAGLAATGKEMISPTPGGGDPEGFRKSIQDKLTYSPRTDAGKNVAEYNPLALVGKGLGATADAAGNLVGGDAAGNTVRGAAGNFTREALQQAPGFIAPALKKPIAARVATREAELAAEKTQNVTRDANIEKARAAGITLPPAVAGVKGPLSSFFSAEAGGTKLDYGSSFKNQRVVNAKVKKELGISGDKPLSIEALEDVRDKYSKPYEDVKSAVPTLKTTKAFKDALDNPNSHFAEAKKEFPEYFKNKEVEDLVKTLSKDKFSSKAAIELQKKLRADGNTNMKAFDDVSKQSLGEAQLNAAKAIDNLIDENLQMQAPPGVKNFQSKLASNLAEARKKIAQTYAVQGALNDASGNISAANLGRLWDKQGTLTGGLKEVAELHNAFPKQMRNVDKLPGTAHETVSNMDVAKATLLGATGHGLLGAASTAGRAAIKPILLSDWYQNLNIKPPKYEVGPTLKNAKRLSENPAPGFGIPRPPQQQDDQ